MFSQGSVILSTIGLMPTQPLLILVCYSVTCYSAVAVHPTGMLSCFHCFVGLCVGHNAADSNEILFVTHTSFISK